MVNKNLLRKYFWSLAIFIFIWLSIIVIQTFTHFKIIEVDVVINYFFYLFILLVLVWLYKGADLLTTPDIRFTKFLVFGFLLNYFFSYLVITNYPVKKIGPLLFLSIVLLKLWRKQLLNFRLIATACLSFGILYILANSQILLLIFHLSTSSIHLVLALIIVTGLALYISRLLKFCATNIPKTFAISIITYTFLWITTILIAPWQLNSVYIKDAKGENGIMLESDITESFSPLPFYLSFKTIYPYYANVPVAQGSYLWFFGVAKQISLEAFSTDIRGL
jgi:hypothetical protein